jgi:predicted cobalt transporter CbtA
MLRKFGPFAILVGYVAMYSTGAKGLAAIIPDFQNITLAKLQAKWQNFAVAAIAGLAVTMLHKIKLPAVIKTIITIVLYFVIGWQLATAIDPPGSVQSSQATAAYSQPVMYNPYSNSYRQ